VPQIAQRLARNEYAIRKWLRAYQTHGVQGLGTTPPPGRPPLQGGDLAHQLETMLAHSPSHYGYLEAGWIVDMIRDHCRQEGLMLSDATVRRRLKAGGWVYKCFAKTLPYQAPSAEQKKAGGTNRPRSKDCASLNRSKCSLPMSRTGPLNPMCNAAGFARGKRPKCRVLPSAQIPLSLGTASQHPEDVLETSATGHVETLHRVSPSAPLTFS
jgi:transposase